MGASLDGIVDQTGAVFDAKFYRSEYADGLTFFGCVDLLAMGTVTGRVPCISLEASSSGAACRGWVIGALLVGSELPMHDSRVHFIAEARLLAKLTLGPIAFLGRLSLQLYVFHMMWVVLAMKIISPWPSLFLSIAACVGLEILVLEPANRAIQRYYSFSESKRAAASHDGGSAGATVSALGVTAT
ncbi:hypothetical protein [Bradyrhizobium diazoefficiens]|uniref:hypothetical protein n=1 Tax=Bradyrhizobium diazoefficiens TaxID=1355477 RepID=UPI0034E5EAE2